MLLPQQEVVVDVILVEDHPMMANIIIGGLEKVGFRVTLARNLVEGQEVITNNHKHSVAVLLDGSLGNGQLSTPLIKLLKKLQYKGKIIAISDDPDTNEILFKSGCTTFCLKKEVLEFVPKTLNKKQ